jgi:hypothetical protein
MMHGVGLKVKPVGKPDAVAPHVRFDERGWETEQKPPRLSSTLPIKRLPGFSLKY